MTKWKIFYHDTMARQSSLVCVLRTITKSILYGKIVENALLKQFCIH